MRTVHSVVRPVLSVHLNIHYDYENDENFPLGCLLVCTSDFADIFDDSDCTFADYGIWNLNYNSSLHSKLYMYHFDVQLRYDKCKKALHNSLFHDDLVFYN